MGFHRTPIRPIVDLSARVEAAAALRAGDIVGVPTDTVYGVAAAFDRADGIAALYALKGRAIEKAIPLLLSDVAQLGLVTLALPDEARTLIEAHWPGPLTLVLRKHSSVLDALAPGRSTVGVRIPAHPALRSWIDQCGGPIACSSANQSGEAPAVTALEVAETFPTGLQSVLDGGRATVGVASSVVDLSDPSRPLLLREGALPRERLEAALGMVLG